jgi:hypothetical protein
MRRWGRIEALLVASLHALAAAPADAAACPDTGSAIATDRPDVTNSSLVVPTGSLQLENGVNRLVGADTTTVNATDSRLRAGLADCLELLADLPSYSGPTRGRAPGGVSDLTPAVKRQLAPLPGDVVVSAVVGIALPTGDARIAPRGVNPYLQLPWSRELAGGWSLSGMVTAFWLPHRDHAVPTVEPTLVLGRALDARIELFVEYVADIVARTSTSQLINTGSSLRLTPTQQIDIHGGFGVAGDAPRWFVGVGYSLRLDQVF